MTTNLSLEQILNETESFSTLSQEPSFTLTDILEQPPDEDLMDDILEDEENFDDMFDDEGMFDDDEQESESATGMGSPGKRSVSSASKVYEYPPGTTSQTSGVKNATNSLQSDRQSSPILPDRVSHPKVEFPQFPPEDIVEMHSVSSYEHSQYPHFKHQRLEKTPLMPVEEIQNMSFIVLKNVTQLFNDINNTHIGISTCLSATSNKFLAIGTSMGSVVLFQVGIKGHKVLSTQEQRKYGGSVSSVSISQDNRYLAVGYEGGLVAVWDLGSLTLLKQQLSHPKTKIIQVLFCTQNYEHFVSSDIEGNTCIYTIERYLWTTNLKYQKLIDRIPSVIFYDIRYHQLANGHCLLALCCLDFVLLVLFKPEVKVIGKLIRPEGVPYNWFPNVQMGRCDVEESIEQSPSGNRDRFERRHQIFYEVLLISWGKKIYLHRLIPAAVVNKIQIEQLHCYEHGSIVYNMEYLAHNTFVTLDEHQVFKTIGFDLSLPNISKTDSNPKGSSARKSVESTSRKGVDVACRILNTHEMEEEVIYQRFVKNKENKYIKSFTNTAINCTIFGQSKEIFFVCKNSIYRSRLHPWKEIVKKLIYEQKSHIQAMKVCVELAHRRLNIFSDKLELQGRNGQRDQSFLCEVGSEYLQYGLKSAKENNLDRTPNYERAETDIKEIQPELQELFQTVVEYFLSIRCESYLFETIYPKVIKNLPGYEYSELFLECLRPFIVARKISRIPNMKFFKELLAYFSHKASPTPEQSNMSLLDTLIINLDTDSLFYEEAVSILSENKLYKALAYLCSVNKDFVSPCSKLFSEMLKCKETNRQNAETEYLEILVLYISKIVEGKYISGKQIERRVYEKDVIRDIALWLTFEQTMKYFVCEKQSEFQCSSRLKTFVGWIDHLLQESSKFRKEVMAESFHETFKLALETLELLQKKSKQIQANEENFHILRANLTAMLKVHGVKHIRLNYEEIRFYVKNTYLSLKSNRFDQSWVEPLPLGQELCFTLQYFQELHSVDFDEFTERDKNSSAFAVILAHANEWVKYLHNYIISNLTPETAEKQFTEDEKEASWKTPQKPSFVQLSKSTSKKSSESNEKLAKSIRSEELAENKTKIQKISLVHLRGVYPVSSNQDITNLDDAESVQSNEILAEFLIENSPFEMIDRNMEQLLKLSTEAMIVYILDHYSIEMVNAKIDRISDEQSKYFIVRRILKNLRREKQEQLQPTSDQRLVWGSQYKSYRKKKQFLEKKQSAESQLSSRCLSKPTKLFYLNSLTKYKRQKRVYSELKDHFEDYMSFSEEVLKIVQEKELKSCIAFLKLKSQEYVTAFESYKLVYNERFEVNMKKLALVQHCHGRFQRKVFDEMLNICQLMNSKEQWMGLLEAVLEPLTEINKFKRGRKQQVIELIQKIFESHPSHSFIQELGEIIESTLLEVSSNISAAEIAKVLDDYSDLLNKTYILNCLKSTMKTYTKSIFIYETSNDMVVHDQANAFERIYQDYKIRGMSYLPICEICSNLITFEDKVNMYQCSHVYHKSCMNEEQTRCVKCVLLEVGEETKGENLSVDYELLKIESKENEKAPLSLEKQREEESKSKELEEQENMNTIYRCLAFDDYLSRDEAKFSEFRRDYEVHLRKYQ